MKFSLLTAVSALALSFAVPGSVQAQVDSHANTGVTGQVETQTGTSGSATNRMERTTDQTRSMAEQREDSARERYNNTDQQMRGTARGSGNVETNTHTGTHTGQHSGTGTDTNTEAGVNTEAETRTNSGARTGVGVDAGVNSGVNSGTGVGTSGTAGGSAGAYGSDQDGR